jgi:hypothetical protein
MGGLRSRLFDFPPATQLPYSFWLKALWVIEPEGLEKKRHERHGVIRA